MKGIRMEWAPIKSLPGYFASSEGHIRKGERTVSQHVMEQNGVKYARIQVPVDGKRKWRRVNRLVCEAFHGQPATEDMARHLNGDSLDNRKDNLAWGSAWDNYNDQVRHGTAHLMAGQPWRPGKPPAKPTEDMIAVIDEVFG